MSKDPAFLFYTNDFQSGTLFFSDEQVGKYIRLLMAQHQHGHLNEKQVLFICKTLDEDIMSKFQKDEQGLYFNEKLESVINARSKFSESRRNNRLGKKKDHSQEKDTFNTSYSYDKHMENEIENVNVKVNTKEKEDKTPVFNFKKELLKFGFDSKLVDEWLVVRKTKRLVNTETALKQFISEVGKSKKDMNLVLRKCVEKSWGGFDAKWLQQDAKEPEQDFKKWTTEFK